MPSGQDREASGRTRVVCIGECMIELAHTSSKNLQLAFGGDTSNTAIYLARLTEHLSIDVDYVTAIGDDSYSDAMLARWNEEGVGTSLVTRLAGRLPGLYTIRTDDKGERSFTYWRGQSAARDLLREGRVEALLASLENVDLVYLSGITLSILDDAQREALLGLLKQVRESGGRVAFDSNYRPAGWPDQEKARMWFRAVLGITDIALPTLDDERALFGDPDEMTLASRLHDLGVREAVIKLGGAGCLLSVDGVVDRVGTRAIDQVIDSTAAGDSFNAAYLGARLAGMPPKQAAERGHRLAGEVVQHRGAVIPMDAMRDMVMAG